MKVLSLSLFFGLIVFNEAVSNTIIEVDVDKSSSATGGKVFQMNKLFSYRGSRMDFNNIEYFPEINLSNTCDKWVVITSIFEPTDTVKQLAMDREWCVVVVGDKNGPSEYDIEGVIYLTPEDQMNLPYKIIDLLPWNHFGRKNVGYLYAVHHGATVIYDVDDDNSLINPEYGVPYTESVKATSTFITGPGCHVHNPYGCFNGPQNVWPRGFPLESINDADCSVCESSEIGENVKIGVIQSLANHDPDVDAIYRLTYPPGGLPFDFDVSFQNTDTLKVVPTEAFTPYNAQATLHFQSAFWGMLLPVTVHGRVSDIWRSYFTQALLPLTDSVVAFSPSWVHQFRNPHNYLADFQAELPLYERSGALVEFLELFRNESIFAGKNGTDLPSLIEDLVISMYEHGIVERKDVKLTQAWVMDLYSIGYTF